MCAETIRAAAKVCPHCRQWQTKWSMPIPSLNGLGVGITLLAVWLGGGFFLAHLMSPGRDFGKYQDQIVVVNSQMSLSRTDKSPYASVVGTIKNTSPYSWKEVQLEVQYFDKDGKLIDTKSDREYDATILAGAERAFRIRAVADKPEAAYASHKVFVRAAKDARSWP